VHSSTEVAYAASLFVLLSFPLCILQLVTVELFLLQAEVI